MGKFIKLKKGFTINLAGKAAPKVVEPEQPETFVIKPSDFQGIYLPKVVVKEGDSVKAGTALFHDKKHENILFTAPISGEIVEIKRGDKRRLRFLPTRRLSLKHSQSLPFLILATFLRKKLKIRS
jgi:Na+-transporting NADH:ubiquinone oxidoreductase subunit A